MLDASEFDRIKGFDPVNDRVDKMILDKVISESKTASKRILSNRIFAREKVKVQMRLSERILDLDLSLNETEDNLEPDQIAKSARFSKEGNPDSLVDDPGERRS